MSWEEEATNMKTKLLEQLDQMKKERDVAEQKCLFSKVTSLTKNSICMFHPIMDVTRAKFLFIYLNKEIKKTC